MSTRLPFLIIFISFFSGLSACGGSGGASNNGSGMLSVGITDAPVDSAQAVVIHFNSVTVHGDEGNIYHDLTDPDTGLGRSIDLLALQGGQWAGLFDDEIPAGHYSWIRLGIDLDPSLSYIQVAGQQYQLECNSCENNGYKLVSSFTLDSDAVLALMLDFDLRKSITNPNNDPTVYKLRPTVRVVETETSGSISGLVDSTLIASLGGSEGCSVYVFDGADATPDDIYIPLDAIPLSQNNPVSTAMVQYDDGVYHYRVAFLPQGEYTVVLTCDAEDDTADSDDTLSFYGAVNETVVPASTKTVNFN